MIFAQNTPNLHNWKYLRISQNIYTKLIFAEREITKETYCFRRLSVTKVTQHLLHFKREFLKTLHVCLLFYGKQDLFPFLQK
jgi:hypothetical protein